ncbi:MAG: DUF362 domain-containing protein [Candidatus Eisenbacteria bacterium]|nr:DUF362 domain-containing protein [Candidatus Eisenbacteria bacterium]
MRVPLPRRVPARICSALIGLAALAWFLLRTGTRPSRAVYPCQRAALSTSWAFLAVPFAAFVPMPPRRMRGRSGRGPAVAAVVAVGVVGLVIALQSGAFTGGGERDGWDRETWLGGLSERAPLPRLPGRVAHVTDARATSWDFETGWYGDYIDQAVVTSMVEDGLLALTEAPSVAEAWELLIPDFEPGQKVAIKVNLNNTRSELPGKAIDAVIEPVNAVIAGLVGRGFAPSDITVYDVTRGAHDGRMPDHLPERCAYEGVGFVAYVGNDAPFSNEKVEFDPSGREGISDRPLARVMVEADYLINMPIAKAHDFAGMSVSFKNHFGSIDRCDHLHPYVFLRDDSYTPDYSPMLELYAHEDVGGKTVLTVCDALFGTCTHLWSPPTRWPSCGGPPNSILLSTDPVALDCVVADMLAEQGAIPEGSDDYLVLAGEAGMGVCERAGDDGEYAAIDYLHIERP